MGVGGFDLNEQNYCGQHESHSEISFGTRFIFWEEVLQIDKVIWVVVVLVAVVMLWDVWDIEPS